MTVLLPIARSVFAICIAAFGILHLLYGHFRSGLPPFSSWTPGGRLAVQLLGLLLILLAAGLLSDRFTAPSATVLGLLCLPSTSFLYGSHLAAIVRDGSLRTAAFESLALAGAAFTLRGVNRSRRLRQPSYTRRLTIFGVALFALSMLVFGEQHVQYRVFVASLIPAWIPAHLFWTYATAAIFLIAGIGLLTLTYRAVAGFSLSLMFLGWVLVLHGPRVNRAPRNLEEWSSLIVALSMAAGSILVAGQPPPRNDRRETYR